MYAVRMETIRGNSAEMSRRSEVRRSPPAPRRPTPAPALAAGAAIEPVSTLPEQHVRVTAPRLPCVFLAAESRFSQNRHPRKEEPAPH